MITLIKKNKYAVLLFLTFFSFLVSFYCQYPGLFNKYVIHDDVTQYVFPFYRVNDPALFTNDLLTQYSLSNFNSRGIIFIYTLAAKYFDPLILTKILPFVLSLISTFYIYAVFCVLFKDYMARLVCGVLFLLYVWTLCCFSGGLARSFAFPLLLSFFYYLLKKQYLALFFIVLAQCFFYPQVALISVLTFFLAAINFKGGFPSIEKRELIYSFLFIVLVVLVLTYVYMFKSSTNLVTYKEAKAMSEFYPGGRTPFFYNNVSESLFSTRSGFGWDVPFKWLLAFLVAVVAMLWKRAFSIRKENWCLLLASFILFIMARLLFFKIYYPAKYLMYTLPLFLIFFIGTNIDKLIVKKPALFKGLVGVACVLLMIVIYRPFLKSDLIDYSENSSLYVFLSTLPKDALLAGNPNLMDAVPIFSKRKVLVTFELSQPWYKNYYGLIKERIIDFFKIYYSDSFQEVKDLCRKYGIEYLVVNKEHFSRAYLEKGEFYVQPFNDHIKSNIIINKKRFVLNDVPEEKKIFKRDNIFVVKVLNLKRAD